MTFSSTKPTILDPKKHQALVAKLLRNRNVTVVDSLVEDKKELAVVKNPALLRDPKFSSRIFTAKRDEGVWVYYPWRHTLAHTLPRNDFEKVRLSRNGGFIDAKEQERIKNIRVGIAGLNVGNPGAVCMALSGFARFKLADNDILSLSNLNRFRAGLPDLGLNKAVLSARQIWEINPFAEIEVWKGGIAPATIENFLLSPRIDILIEEMDHPGLKIAMREHARLHGIPVVMVTGNEAGTLLDVERYDQNKNGKLLNGYLSHSVEEKIKSGTAPSFDEKIKIARDFMGKTFLTRNLLKSFLAVGSKLAGIPQLAEASFLRGAVLTYAVRKVAAGKLASGRYTLPLSALVPLKK